MGKRALKRTILLIISLMVIGGAGGFLLGTEQGLRATFTVAAKLVPGKLTAQELTGSLLGSTNISKLYFENNSFKLSVDKIDFGWRIQELLFGKVSIPVIHANDLMVVLKSSEAVNKKKLNLSDLKADLLKFLSMVKGFEDLELINLSFQQAGFPLITLNKAAVKTRLTNGDLEEFKAEIQGDDAKIIIQGTAQDKLDFMWKLSLPKLNLFAKGLEGAIDSEGKVYGKHDASKIDGAIDLVRFKYNGTKVAKLKGDVHVDLSAPEKSHFKFDISSPEIDKVRFDRLAFDGIIYPPGFKKREFNFKINFNSASMFLPIGDGLQSVKFEGGDLQGAFGTYGSSLQGKFFVEKNDPINIALKLPKLVKLSGLLDNQPIKGQVVWKTEKLAFLQQGISRVKDLKGAIDLQLALAGTLQAPRFVGDAKLYNASVKISGLNIWLEDVNLDVHALQKKIEYQGKLNSQGGFLNFDGATIFSSDGSSSRFSIKGKDFLAINNEQYQVTASPELEVKIDGEALDLTGEISIPKAMIKPSGFGGVGSLPPEVEYVDQPQAKEESSLNLYTKIKLILGKKVFIDILGLKGAVQGQLQVTDDPKKTATGLGELIIRDGSYNIYGQQLKITNGSLQFLGGAITNPIVNLEAVRNFKTNNLPEYFKSSDEQLVVGVRMHGALDSSRVSLFSVPAGMSDTDIISYLVIGQPSGAVSVNEAKLLFQAASTLNIGGAGEASNLVEDLREKLGFTEFGLTEETFLNNQQNNSSANMKSSNGQSQTTLATNTAFVLGKFLTPKIYASYSQALLSQENIFRVKYYINKKWSVQSETNGSGGGAVDMIYSIGH